MSDTTIELIANVGGKSNQRSRWMFTEKCGPELITPFAIIHEDRDARPTAMQILLDSVETRKKEFKEAEEAVGKRKL